MNPHIESDNQLLDETTYEEEFTSYHFNKYQSCACYICNFYAKKNIKHTFAYGFMMPLLWLYIIVIYIYQYYILSHNYPTISDDIGKLTQYELDQYQKNHYKSLDNQFKEATNENDDNSTLHGQKQINYQEVYIRECIKDVIVYHEKIQQENSIWAWRSFSAIMVYVCIIFMLVMCATNSSSNSVIIL